MIDTRQLAMLAALVAAAVSPVAGADVVEELAAAEAMLVDVGLRGDVGGLEMARERIRNLERDAEGLDDEIRARILRDLALVDFNLAMSLAGDVERAAEATERMRRATERALDLRPDDPELWVLLNRSRYMSVTTGSAELAAVAPAMRETAARAREADADHPLVHFLHSLDLIYGGDVGAAARGMAMMDAAIDRLGRGSGPVERFWHLLVRNFKAQVLLGRGEILEARRTIDSLLEDRPDYRIVRESLLPMTAPAEAAAPPELGEEEWTELATDPRGDARAPGLPDVHRLSYHHDPAAGWLWFRLELAEAVEPAAVGINIPVDVDADQSTGSAWWGGNRDFRWDRLVTVWVARMEDGSYRGTVGVGDTEGAAEGRYVNRGRSGVRFALGERALYVGLPRGELTSERHIRLIGVVGTNTQWSDPVPDEGSVKLELQER